MRSTRARYGISPKQELAITVKAPAEVVSTINEQQDLIVSLARVSVAGVSAEAEKPAASNATLVSGCEVYCHLEGLVDFEAERARLSKEREKLEKDVAKLDKKLSNPGYLAKAKPEIVEKDKAKRAEFAAKLELVAQQIAEL